ncbi:MAG: nucleotidyltransferase domain-containing protein [Capsulimonadales bacterium]|nr:nucleotidyltransferase domain-containing protein [Capsulimonadales bacterium]
MKLRRRERDALLTRMVGFLRDDRRVAAVWLWGSLGRGTGDDWSDLDLWVVTDDPPFDAIREDFAGFIAPFSPLFVLEQTPNGPPGGTSFNVAFPGGETGAQNVDFTLWQRKAAWIGTDARLLFDRGNLPKRAEPLTTGGNPEPEYGETECLLRETRFFFLMWLVCVKYVARNPGEERMGLFPYVVNAGNAVRHYFGHEPLPDVDGPRTPSPEEKIATLRRAMDELAAVLPRVRDAAARDGLPFEVTSQAVSASLRFLDSITPPYRQPDNGPVAGEFASTLET